MDAGLCLVRHGSVSETAPHHTPPPFIRSRGLIPKSKSILLLLTSRHWQHDPGVAVPSVLLPSCSHCCTQSRQDDEACGVRGI